MSSELNLLLTIESTKVSKPNQSSRQPCVCRGSLRPSTRPQSTSVSSGTCFFCLSSRLAPSLNSQYSNTAQIQIPNRRTFYSKLFIEALTRIEPNYQTPSESSKNELYLDCHTLKQSTTHVVGFYLLTHVGLISLATTVTPFAH